MKYSNFFKILLVLIDFIYLQSYNKKYLPTRISFLMVINYFVGTLIWFNYQISTCRHNI